jgi:hypothetical protein
MCAFKLFAVISVLLSQVHVCTPAPGTLRVATCAQGYPPFVLKNNADGRMYGLEVEEVIINYWFLSCAKPFSSLSRATKRSHALTRSSAQWESIDKILRRRVSEKRDPIAMELVGTEPAPILQMPSLPPRLAIDMHTKGLVDVSFCGYASILL